jgi:RHS repeat-associated protein
MRAFAHDASRRLAWLLGGLLLTAQLPAHAAVEYIHTDSLGTPVAITDSDGNVVQTSEYEPYGKLLNRPLTDAPAYTGHEADATTGMVYMQQRYYDPEIGRFLSVDPLRGAGFNRYEYARDNPFKFTDPDGREPCTGTHIGSCGSDGKSMAGMTDGRLHAIRKNPQAYIKALNNLPKPQRDVVRAARYFSGAAMPVTMATGREVGADIAKIGGDKPYLATNFALGDPAAGDGSGSVQQGQTYQGPGMLVATIHTHPVTSTFSGANGCYCYGGYRGAFVADSDVHGALQSGVDSYIANPDGSILRFNFSQMRQDVSAASSDPNAYLKASSYMSRVWP